MVSKLRTEASCGIRLRRSLHPLQMLGYTRMVLRRTRKGECREAFVKIGWYRVSHSSRPFVG